MLRTRFGLFSEGRLQPARRRTRDTARSAWARPRLEALEDRTLLDANLGLIKTQFGPLLDALQSPLGSRVLNAALPIVGRALQGTSATAIFTDLRNLAQQYLTNLPDSPTTADIQQMLQNSFGTLIQPATITVGGDGRHEITFALTIQRGVTASTSPVSFDLDLPGVGFGVSGSASVMVSADYSFQMTFGVNDTVGFFIDLPASGFTLHFNAGLAPTSSLSATLGFLTLTANNNQGAGGTGFSGRFNVTLVGPSGNPERVSSANFSGISARSLLNAMATVRLDVTAGFAQSTVTPRLRGLFSLDWGFQNADPQAALASLGNTPTVQLQNIQLDLGPFFGSLVRPIVDRIHRVTEPFEDVATVLGQPVPLLKQVGVNRSLLQLIGDLTGADTSYVSAIIQFIQVTKVLSQLNVSANTWIDLGSYNLTGDVDPRTLANPGAVPVNQLTAPSSAPLAQARSRGGAPFFDAAQTNMPGPGLHFPILENPRTAFKLFFGQAVDLFTYQLPSLSAGYRQSYSFNFLLPPGVPLVVTVGGSLTFNANLAFGMDTSGLTGSGNVLDGLFLDFRNGQPLLSLQATLTTTAGLGVSLNNPLFGISVTLAGGGLSVNAALNLNPQPGLLDNGKLHLPQIIDAWDRGGIGAVFNLGGSISASIIIFSEFTIRILGISYSHRETWVNITRTLYDFSSLFGDTRVNPIPGVAVWTGGADDRDWDNPQNWTPNVVPDANTDVYIGQGGVDLEHAATVRSLEMASGVLAGSGDLTVGTLTWTGGTMTGSGHTRVSGSMVLSGTGRRLLDGRTLDNLGTATWTDGGELKTTNGAVWNNQSGALLDIQTGSATLSTSSATGGRFNNAGQLRKSAGSTFIVGTPLTNTGTVLASGGTLRLDGDLDGAGTWTANGSGVLDFEQGTTSFPTGSTVNGTGTVTFASGVNATTTGTFAVAGTTRVNGGVLVVNGDANTGTLSLEDGRLDGSATLTVTGSLAWIGGEMRGTGHVRANGGMTISGTHSKYLYRGTLDNNGVAVWSDGVLYLGEGAVWNNLPGSLLDIQGSNPMHQIEGAVPRLTNAGTVLAEGGGTTVIDTAITNTGQFIVQSGRLALVSALPADNTLTGGTYLVQATLQMNTSLGWGIGSTFILDGPGSAVRSNADTDALADLGRITAQGTLILRHGRLFSPGTDVNNAGVARVEDTSDITLAAHTWTNTTVVQAAGTNGVTVSGGTFLMLDQSSVTGPGRLEVDGGSARIDAGTATVQNLRLAQIGTVSGAGTVAVSVTFNWFGGTMTGVGTTAVLAGATFSISGSPSYGSTLAGGRTLSNAGTGQWSGGVSAAMDSSSVGVLIANLAGGVMDFLDGAYLFPGSGTGVAPVLRNTGTVQKSTGMVPQSATIGVYLDDQSGGQVLGLAGTLMLSGGGQLASGAGFSAGSAAAAGGELRLSDGTFVALAGSTVTVAGSGTLTVGYLAGSTGQLAVRSGATLSGSAAGTLSVSGGTLVDDVNATVGNLSLSSTGTIGGVGRLAVSTSFSWFGGTMTGVGTTAVLAGATFSIGGSPSYGSTLAGGRTLSNAGTGQWSGGVSAAADSSSVGVVVTNLAGGLIDFGDNGYLFAGSGTGVPPVFHNAGTLRKSTGTGTAGIGVALDSSGSVQALSGTLSFSGAFANFANHTLTGGSYLIVATLQFAGADVRTVAANIVVDGPNARLIDLSSGDGLAGLAGIAAGGVLTVQHGASVAAAGGFSNAGAVVIAASSTFSVAGAYTQTGGSTTLSGGTFTANGGVTLSGGLLTGFGVITGNVTNAAEIDIGTATAVGTLTITGNYTQTGAGTLAIKVGGPSAGTGFDVLTVSGQATLDGTLRVTLINGFTPGTGNRFRFLTAQATAGAFATLAGDGSRFSVSDDGSSETLVAH
jgi:hypothetical protein